MASPIILDRLRRGLAAEFTVEEELASGGMGTVYRGHDHALRRPVAIKVMRPELATASAAEAFVAEARILAGLHHPNVVQVYRAGEVAGLFYYVMEFIEQESLEARLRRGPLPLDLALKVGRDLLDGLEAAHRLGVIHRDVKPANILLVGRRALLTDFGIALPVAGEGIGAPAPPLVGTPGYMAPEQAAGDLVTPQTDLYAAGAVLYEAITGRAWHQHEGDWRGIPAGIGRVLRRALARDPAARWPDAATFRRALWRTRTRRYFHRTLILIAAGLVVGFVGARTVPRLVQRGGGRFEPFRIVVHRFDAPGDGPAAALADSMVELVRASLEGNPDFSVASGFLPDPSTPSLVVTGRLTPEGAGLRVRVEAGTAGERPLPIGADFRSPSPAAREISDSVTARVLRAVWAKESPIASSLPLQTLPHTDAGLSEFLAGERLVGEARWQEAYDAYTRAEQLDSTCRLCSWRITDVQRWLGMDRDPARLQSALAHADSFPEAYRSLIHAAVLPVAPRLDTLEAAAGRSRDFFLPALEFGDELFHRGALTGRRRHEALAPLERAARLRPDYAPTWEHLLWVRVAEGDSAGAAEALDALERRGTPRDPFSRQLRALLHVGFAWRFFGPNSATAGTAEVLGDPEVARYPALGAGPRLLPTFDAPAGAVAMGRMFFRSPRADLARSGLLAALFGATALGRLDEAEGYASAYRARALDPEGDLFVAEWRALRAVFDPSEPAERTVGRQLFHLAARGAGTDLARRRALWAGRLVSRHRGWPWEDSGDARELPLVEPFRTLLLADSLAARGDAGRALDLTEAFAGDPAIGRGDPFLRAAIHLLRADWYLARGNDAAATRTLRWHENTDLVGYPVGDPQAAEVDWAFGTLARWRRARLLDRADVADDELCAAYRGVERHWAGGDALFAARADTARRRADHYHCPAA